jgi:hypothetical protein
VAPARVRFSSDVPSLVACCATATAHQHSPPS